jgi:hypothetical protein
MLADVKKHQASEQTLQEMERTKQVRSTYTYPAIARASISIAAMVCITINMIEAPWIVMVTVLALVVVSSPRE